MKRTYIYLTLAAMAVSALSALTACSGKDEKEKGASASAMGAGGMAPTLAVETLEPTTIELESSYPATIKGKTDIDVRPMISGNIVAVHVDEGQHVTKGQLLFTIDQTPYQAAVDQAQAAVNSARSAVESQQISVNSNRTLRSQDIISEQAMKLSENQLAQAKSALAQAEAALVNAKKNLSYTEVLAPSSGVIGAIPLRVGALASPSGQALTTVSDNSEVYAYFSMTEKQILDLTEGGAKSLNAAIKEMPAVRLRLANGSMYPQEGHIATVSGVIDATTGASTVRALFNNANGVLRSGSTGQVIIPTLLTDVIVIPQKATGEIQGMRYVYTVDSNNVLQQQTIQIYPLQDGKNFVVTSGLNPGDRIITQGIGTMSVRPGVTINPAPEVTQ